MVNNSRRVTFERVSALGIAEKRIMLRLLQTESLTFSNLIEGEEPVGHRPGVSNALNYLEDRMYTEAPARRGRRRRPHTLTETGFWTSMALPEVWETPETIRRIAEVHSARLPLIFGKIDYFESKGILEEILSRLKFVVEIKDLERASILTTIGSESPPENKTVALLNYPEGEGERTKTLSDIITADVFGLNVLTKLDVSNTLTLAVTLLCLQEDPQLRLFILKYLRDEMVENQTEFERLGWWADFLDKQI